MAPIVAIATELVAFLDLNTTEYSPDLRVDVANLLTHTEKLFRAES